MRLRELLEGTDAFLEVSLSPQPAAARAAIRVQTNTNFFIGLPHFLIFIMRLEYLPFIYIYSFYGLPTMQG